MKKIAFIITITLASNLMAQNTATDIPVNSLPKEVKTVLEEYVSILRNSATLDECATAFLKLAGGGLVNESVSSLSLRSSIKDYSLKKDWSGIKFYANPLVITRVNSPETLSSQGYGESAISGRVYKIWIAKANSSNGMPAPVSIMVPQGHSSILTPKIVNIGSF